MSKPRSTATFAAGSQRHMAFMPGRLVLRFHPDALQPTVNSLQSGAIRGMRRASSAVPTEVSDCLKWLTNNAGLKAYRPLFADHRAAESHSIY